MCTGTSHTCTHYNMCTCVYTSHTCVHVYTDTTNYIEVVSETCFDAVSSKLGSQ